MDEMEPTEAQKNEWIIESLGILGFTDNSDYPGVYTQEHGMKNIVKNLNISGTSYFLVDKKKVEEDDEHGTLAKVDRILKEAETGQMPSRTEPDEVVNVTKTVNPADDALTQAESVAPPVPARKHVPQNKLPPEQVELTIDIVKKYINEKVTDEEAYRFIQLCKARHLNPFLGQVHLIKRDFTGTAKTVVGKDVFMERAVRHPQYDGFEAGIILNVKDQKTTEDRPGAFHDENEKLVGGWAKVHRKDQKYFTEARVSMTEYNTGKASWAKLPATMIRKVPLVQALREAFAEELSGMYDSSEMDVEIE